MTTGTCSHSAANTDSVSTHQIQPVPLPLLTLEQSRPRDTCIEQQEMRNNLTFCMAIDDTGGLPGLIHWMASNKGTLLHVQQLHKRTHLHVGANWDHRWRATTSVCPARPQVNQRLLLTTECRHPESGDRHPTSEPIKCNHMVQDVLDGGTVF